MTTTLVVADPLASRLRELTALGVETGAVMLARVVETPGGERRLLVTHLFEVPDQAYERREAQALQIGSEGYVPPLREAEATGSVPIWFHTHPGKYASPAASEHDRLVDQQLAPLFRFRANSEYYGALILSGQGTEFRFTGHLDSESKRSEIDRLLIVGSRLALLHNDGQAREPLPSLFDRNIRAFGDGIQRVLQDLRVAVVGCGGVGSAVAEQLVRLGVRHFILIDSDSLTESNLTRVYGSVFADVGRPKVEVLAGYLQRIAPSTRVVQVRAMITNEGAARELLSADLVFGCTDDNAGRLVLSRLAIYFLKPVIDCGVLLTDDGKGRIEGIHGRVTVLYPGAACLVCRNRIDLARAVSETMSAEERDRLVKEGYAPALPGVEPAVVAFTSLVAATAIGELLERLTAYGPDPVPSEVLLRIHDREISSNEQAPRVGHYCHPASGKWGRGMTEPFLEQTWGR